MAGGSQVPDRTSAEPGRRGLRSRLLGVALLLILLAGPVAASARSAAAVEPHTLTTASIVPADVQSLIAFEADASNPQLLKAQELLERAGLPASTADLASSVSSIAPVEGDAIETLPTIENGEIAIGIRGLSLEPFSGLSDVSIESGELRLPDSGPQFSGPLGVAVVITAANLDQLKAEIEIGLRDEAQTAGVQLEESVVEQARVLVLAGDPRLDMPGTGDSGVVVALLDNALILSATADDVLPYIQAAAGSVPNLATEPDFQTVMSSLPAEALIAGYVAAATDADYTALESMAREAGYPIALELLVGQRGPGGFAVSAVDEGFRFDSVQLASAGAPGTPVASAPPFDLTFAERVPADSLLFINGANLGETLAFRLIEQLLIGVINTAAGTSADDIPEITQEYLDGQYAGLSLLFGFNVQKDLIRQLQGEYGFALSQIDVSDPANVRAILVSDVVDPEAVNDALASLGGLVAVASDGAAVVSQATVGEYTVSQITADIDGSQTVIQYGVIDDQLVVSIGEGLVEYVLGVTETLADNPDYQEAMGYLPAVHQGVFYVGLPALIEAGSSLAGGAVADIDSDLSDASQRCGSYPSQEAAQTAYDEDPVENFDLDVDFDGLACDDYFPDTSAISVNAGMTFDINLGALAAVSYQQDQMRIVSGILVIPDGQPAS